MGARILIGTASWADKPLVESGAFYPHGAKSAEQRLRYYSTRFPLVEVDATYYGLPQVKVAQRWVERTPPEFLFDVKAYSLFTEHPTPVQRLPNAIKEVLPSELASKSRLYREDVPPRVVDLCWSTFIDGLLPLHDAGKLGVVAFQFPKWVFPNRRTKDYLAEIRDRLGPYRGAVEFRNDVWLNPENREEVLTLLGDLDFTYTCVDEPQGFSSSVPPIAVATNRLGIVRFHGRNAQTWERRTRTSAERFDYWYTSADIAEWVPKIEALADEVDELHLVVNTNQADQGPRNADLITEHLERSRVASGVVRP
jgi:uncharacterized protein YecE (DUF72 family)